MTSDELKRTLETGGIWIDPQVSAGLDVGSAIGPESVSSVLAKRASELAAGEQILGVGLVGFYRAIDDADVLLYTCGKDKAYIASNGFEDALTSALKMVGAEYIGKQVAMDGFLTISVFAFVGDSTALADGQASLQVIAEAFGLDEKIFVQHSKAALDRYAGMLKSGVVLARSDIDTSAVSTDAGASASSASRSAVVATKRPIVLEIVPSMSSEGSFSFADIDALFERGLQEGDRLNWVAYAQSTRAAFAYVEVVSASIPNKEEWDSRISFKLRMRADFCTASRRKYARVVTLQGGERVERMTSDERASVCSKAIAAAIRSPGNMVASHVQFAVGDPFSASSWPCTEPPNADAEFDVSAEAYADNVAWTCLVPWNSDSRFVVLETDLVSVGAADAFAAAVNARMMEAAVQCQFLWRVRNFNFGDRMIEREGDGYLVRPVDRDSLATPISERNLAKTIVVTKDGLVPIRKLHPPVRLVKLGESIPRTMMNYLEYLATARLDSLVTRFSDAHVFDVDVWESEMTDVLAWFEHMYAADVELRYFGRPVMNQLGELVGDLKLLMKDRASSNDRINQWNTIVYTLSGVDRSSLNKTGVVIPYHVSLRFQGFAVMLANGHIEHVAEPDVFDNIPVDTREGYFFSGVYAQILKVVESYLRERINSAV